MIDIVNNQRKIKPDRQIFQTFAEAAINEIPEASNRPFAIAFVSDRKMRELNKKFRGKNSTTDVLSFPFLSEPQAVARGLNLADPIVKATPSANADRTDKKVDPSTEYIDFLGDIVISLEQAERQAKENDLELETEIKQLILHGILHLCGYDHETDAGEMNALELRLRDKLDIS
jgi:probable rRNA maturation factor